MESEQSEQKVLTRAATEPARRKVILLIDDCPDVLLLNKTILEMAGYETVCAGGGTQAFQVLSKMTPPDLILLDVMMDEMSGPEFLTELKFRWPERYANVPVVFMTGMDEVPDVGAVGMIRKPIDVDRFLELIGIFISPRAACFEPRH